MWGTLMGGPPGPPIDRLVAASWAFLNQVTAAFFADRAFFGSQRSGSVAVSGSMKRVFISSANVRLSPTPRCRNTTMRRGVSPPRCPGAW